VRRPRRQLCLPRTATTFVPETASHNYLAFAAGLPHLHWSFRCAHCRLYRQSKCCKEFRQRVFTSLRTVGTGSTELRG
jgi:hypothetical protein